MIPPAIVVTDLVFSYGRERAVNGVSFDVEPGQILGFLGPNGAGKSTTIKMLTGQLRPDGGSIEILGMPMPARREAIQGRIGVCFEEKNLYSAMSAEENLRFFCKLFGVENCDIVGLLERVGLADRRKDRVADYSKGMRQRLMMARTLVNTPDVLFLDEPTDGLDPVSARAIRALVTAEAERGAAILLTTHDMHEADSLSDRVAFINSGEILALDAPEALKLEHGRRTVKVRHTVERVIEEIVVHLDEPGAEDRLREAVANEDIVTIHTEEATLEDVFVTFAGRRLDA